MKPLASLWYGGLAFLIAAGASTGADSSQTAPAPALKIVVISGEDAVNVIQQNTAVAPIVEIRDRNNLPVAGAVVTFAVEGGKAAVFAGGVPTLTVTTNAAGQAVASGLSPLFSGAVQINVQVAFQGQIAAATIMQTNVLTAAQAAAVASGAGGGSSSAATSGAAGSGGGMSGTTLGILGAAVAGGAVAATAAGGEETVAPPSTALPSPPVPFSAIDLSVGNGAEATVGRTVIVSYAGWLYDAFGSDTKGVSIESSTSFIFVLGSGQVIAGFNRGVTGMRVGGLRRITIPPDLGYGTAAPPPIPANSTLVFEVALVEVR